MGERRVREGKNVGGGERGTIEVGGGEGGRFAVRVWAGKGRESGEEGKERVYP